MDHFNSELGMAQSYYAATAIAPPAIGPLPGDRTTDVVVVGGGVTGLAAAYHAARLGLSVTVLEGGRLGWGASGRNGGQMTPGLRMKPTALIKAFGLDHARRMFALATGAQEEVVDLIHRHAINCDLRETGHLDAAIRPGEVDDLVREAECMAVQMNYPHATVLDSAAMAGEVAHPYSGGMLVARGGHYHPLNYTLGLAHAAAAQGVCLYEHTVVIKVTPIADGVVIDTRLGRVRASACVLAGDALLESIDSEVESHVMPVANYIVATRPLENACALIPNNRAISDSRFVVNYYRLSADGRMIFGGGERYTTQPPADIAGFVRPFMERTFPQLSGVEIDYAWGGLVSVTRTRLPHVGRRGPIYWAHGYSGKGAILSTTAGRLIAEAVRGDASGLDFLALAAPPAFPGGTRFRAPLHTLAMLWFAARDRVGI